ncbi:MAG: DsbA family oxidoreductase, partial [Chloroflexi bacterium]|nr:DsbA family oxidoreductase [Chloroflexota bacterium]
MGQERADELEQDYDVDVEWLPFYLHPEVPPEGGPLPAYVTPEYRKATLDKLTTMAPALASRMSFPDKLQYSYRAFEATEFAK